MKDIYRQWDFCNLLLVTLTKIIANLDATLHAENSEHITNASYTRFNQDLEKSRLYKTFPRQMKEISPAKRLKPIIKLIQSEISQYEMQGPWWEKLDEEYDYRLHNLHQENLETYTEELKLLEKKKAPAAFRFILRSMLSKLFHTNNTVSHVHHILIDDSKTTNKEAMPQKLEESMTQEKILLVTRDDIKTWRLFLNELADFVNRHGGLDKNSEFYRTYRPIKDKYKEWRHKTEGLTSDSGDKSIMVVVSQQNRNTPAVVTRNDVIMMQRFFNKLIDYLDYSGTPRESSPFMEAYLPAKNLFKVWRSKHKLGPDRK